MSLTRTAARRRWVRNANANTSSRRPGTLVASSNRAWCPVRTASTHATSHAVPAAPGVGWSTMSSPAWSPVRRSSAGFISSTRRPGSPASGSPSSSTTANPLSIDSNSSR